MTETRCKEMVRQYRRRYVIIRLMSTLACLACIQPCDTQLEVCSSALATYVIEPVIACRPYPKDGATFIYLSNGGRRSLYD